MQHGMHRRSNTIHQYNICVQSEWQPHTKNIQIYILRSVRLDFYLCAGLPAAISFTVNGYVAALASDDRISVTLLNSALPMGPAIALISGAHLILADKNKDSCLEIPYQHPRRRFQKALLVSHFYSLQ